MINNSTKLFQKAIKTGLLTASTMALTLSAGGAALGAARQVVGPAAFDTGAGLDGGGATPFATGSTLQYTTNDAVDGNLAVNVLAIDINGQAPAAFTVNENISLGSVSLNGGTAVPININDTFTLTLTGTGSGGLGFANAADDYTGLGNITLGGANAQLTITSATPAKIILLGNIDGVGKIVANTDTQINGTIGAVNPLTSISIAASTLTLGGADVKATAINLTDNASQLTFSNPVTVTGAIDNTGNAANGIVTFTGASTVTGNVGNTAAFAEVNIGAGLVQLQGAVAKATAFNLTDNASQLTFSNPVTVTGAIDNTGNAANGIVTFSGASTVTGNVGNTAAFAAVNIGAGLVQLQGAVAKATAINLTDNASQLTFSNPVTVTGAIDNTGNVANGIVTFTGASTVTGNVGNTAAFAAVNIGAGLVQLQGAVAKATAFNLTDDASQLTFSNPVTVTGAIDNTGNAANGIVTFTGASTVTGNVGNTAAFAEVSIGAGLVELQGAVAKATAFNLTDNASQLTFSNPVTVTGAIDNTGNAANGIVTFTGASTVTGNVGNTAAFAEVNIGAGLVQLQGAVAKATAFNLTDNASQLTFSNPVTVTGAIDNTGNAANGIVTFTGASTVTGNVGNTAAFAAVNIGAGLVQLQGAVIKATNINLQDNAAILTLTNAAPVLTGNIDFTGFTGTVNIPDGTTVTGNFRNADAANNNGTINFLGNAHVTGFIGRNVIGKAAPSSINTINIKGGAATIVQLDNAVGVANLVFNNLAPAGKVIISSSLSATNIDFGAGGSLTFDSGNNSTFRGIIANGGNGALTIDNDTQLTTLQPTIGTIKDITLEAGENKLLIDTSAGDVTLLADAVQTITFTDADSSLGFINEDNAAAGTVQLGNNLESSGAGQNRLGFFGGSDLDAATGAITNPLTVKSNVVGTVRAIGNGGNTFESLSITGYVNTQDLDLSVLPIINVLAGANFEDKNNLAAKAARVNIGGADPDLGIPDTGGAVYIIDAQGANVDILNGTQIKFADAAGQLTLSNSSNVNNGTITLHATLNPDNVNEGQVLLSSEIAGKTLKIAGAGFSLGGANPLNIIFFDGAGNFDISDITLKSQFIFLDNTAPLTLGAVNSNIVFRSVVTLNQTGTITGDVDFNNNAGTITLSGGSNITGQVKSTGGVNGTLIANGASTIGSVNNIAMLKVGAGAVSIGAGGDTTITEIQGNGTALLTLPANFKLTGGFNLTGGQALKLSFADGSSVSGAVGTAANPVSDIALAGTNTFTGGMNSNGNVTLAKNSVTNFGSNVSAKSFTADGATVNFTSASAFNSNITGSGTTIGLGSTQVAYTGKASFTDVLTLNSTYDGATQTGGNILIKSGSNIDLSQVSSLNLNVTVSNVNLSNISNNAQFKLITSEAAGGLTPVSNDKIKVTVNGNENRFIGITVDTSNLTLFATNISSQVIDEDFEEELANIPDAAAIKQSFKLMANAPEGSDANLALDNFGLMTAAQAVDAVNHLRQNSVKPSEVIAACGQAVSGNIFNNLTSINTRVDNIQAANNFAAVAAGDEDMDAKFGGWVNPFIGNATQKKKNNISGYKSNITGGTIGFDGMINDDAVLGLAYTRAETDVKLKDAKKGDKNKVHSNIYSLYGLYNLPTNNFFVEGVASYADSKVRTKSQRNIATAKDTIGYQTAKGKYKSENYTGQLMVGYNYALPETVSTTPLIVTPLAGLRYSNIKDKGYKETGTTYQNLLVKGKNYNTFDGLVGAKLSSSINTGEVTLIPELHALVDYAFKNKAPAIDARLQGMAAPFPTNSFKPSKTSFDLGAGVTIKHKMMEYGLNYDANIASKYFAQQGSLKVRVNF